MTYKNLVIQGQTPLFGTIKISGSKNAALPIMAASLLTEHKIELFNIPKLQDITTMIHLLENHGAKITINQKQEELNLLIDTSNIENFVAPYSIVSKMRASIWVLAPLLARFGKAEVSLPGGCAIGARQVDLHIELLQKMGATIEINQGYILAKTKDKLKGVDFTFRKISVGATISAVLAASIAQGTTFLKNCAMEPEIVDLCIFLNKLGANINGYGTPEITIHGKTSLNSCVHKIIPDRIEAGTYMVAAAITKGELDILEINPDIVENMTVKLIECGISVKRLEKGVNVKYTGDINAINVETREYPGFSTDLQAQFMSLMTIAKGTSIITENIFENRFLHVPELCRMGANILVEGNKAIVKGVGYLTGAEVMASDLRASGGLVLAALSAKGTTTISHIHHLERGYHSLETKLANCGANIKKI